VNVGRFKLVGDDFPQKNQNIVFTPRIVESIISDEFHMVKVIEDVAIQPMEWESSLPH
jgi:hypothetical protein